MPSLILRQHWLFCCRGLISYCAVAAHVRHLIAQPAPEGATPVSVDGIQNVTLVVLALLTILLGIVPGFLSGIL